VRAAKQFLTYTSPAPLQLAIAAGLAFPPASLQRAATELAAKRDLLCDGLADLGYAVHRPAATYFATTDIAPVAPGMSGQEFCLALPGRCGVVAIPSSVFYDPADEAAGSTLVRWAFCKRDDVLRDALARLASWGR
jgi:N-succinyldiaminopimelate aminotransferase